MSGFAEGNNAIDECEEGIVSFFSLATFFEGRHFVPRWRTRMPPAVTNCPAVALIPNRCEWESLPLRDAPLSFLMSHTLISNYICNSDARIFLAMSSLYVGPACAPSF